MSSQFESCLLSNRNTVVMLPYDKCWLKVKYMQNLVIGSPHVGFISPKFKFFSKMEVSSRLCDEIVSGISVMYLDIFPIWKNCHNGLSFVLVPFVLVKSTQQAGG